MDGDIVGGELGASVYKESLDRDGGLRKIAISQALYTQSQTLEYCDQDREQLYVTVAANKDVYTVLHEAAVWQLLSSDRLGIRMTLFGSGVSGSGCGDLTRTKLEAERSETCAVPEFAMATHEASPFSGHG